MNKQILIESDQFECVSNCEMQWGTKFDSKKKVGRCQLFKHKWINWTIFFVENFYSIVSNIMKFSCSNNAKIVDQMNTRLNDNTVNWRQREREREWEHEAEGESEKEIEKLTFVLQKWFTTTVFHCGFSCSLSFLFSITISCTRTHTDIHPFLFALILLAFR